MCYKPLLRGDNEVNSQISLEEAEALPLLVPYFRPQTTLVESVGVSAPGVVSFFGRSAMLEPDRSCSRYRYVCAATACDKSAMFAFQIRPFVCSVDQAHLLRYWHTRTAGKKKSHHPDHSRAINHRPRQKPRSPCGLSAWHRVKI
jgi:hypothetical protein